MLHKHIDDLSPEILATVFKIVDAQSEPTRKLARRAPPHEIITLSHVSNRWREISTRLQALWGSALPCSSLQWTKLCLERCQTAPFNFSFDYDLFDANEEYHDAACLVFSHLSRAKRLQIFYLPNSGLAENSKLLELCAGMQKCVSENIIEIQVQMSEDELHPVPFDLSLLFRPAVFPRIQRLTFWNMICPFNSSCHVFSHSLITLQIEDSCVWHSVDEMIEVLRCVPLLETFVHETSAEMDLSHLFSPTISHTYPPRCIPLKHLKYLRWLGKGLFAHHLMLFTYLDFPSNTDLILEGARRGPNDDGDLTWGSIKVLIEVAKTCVQKHFQPATASGSFYPVLRLRGEMLDTALPPVQDNGSSPATDVLPPQLSVGVPYMGVHEDDGQPNHDRDCLFGIYTSLPCLARATALLFYEDVTQFTAGLLSPFTCVRRLIFTDMAPAIAFTSFCDTHDKVIFPDLEDVELSFAPSRRRIGAEAYLKVAEILARSWGKTLRSVELQDTYFVEEEDTVVAGFKERLGDERVHVIDSDDEEEEEEEDDGERPGSEDDQSRMEDDYGL